MAADGEQAAGGPYSPNLEPMGWMSIPFGALPRTPKEIMKRSEDHVWDLPVLFWRWAN